MAVVAISGVSQYTGLDTDTKPTDGVGAGSIFWEFDTVAQTVSCWKYNGSTWGEVTDAESDEEETGDDESDDTLTILGQMLEEMTAIRKGMELKLALEHSVNIDLRTEEVTHLQES